ncbi:TrmB family transcriptional regulator [Allosediminivita pacifica]|uniref:Sugar-specific transcriptional regulator TrmB n=1 Tax=Allosediminivita pacifica TaxID=1267769 RepID=A0A2T6A4E0_9RHOB|nr:helix-turn-helix domain-containing protein [Allosediminivita pacifica]PTX38670.1 sugar-specific transcriptional regulator TrmB [Allosediminivita pacifica]GGB28922.1 hypothetical protein GCM10011324_43180 [Allosediminivita pacifica]
MDEGLEALGLNEKEILFYRTALMLGTATVSEISTAAGVTRTNGYDLLSRLKRKGLLTFVETGGSRVVSAEDPRQLLDIMERRKALVRDAVPELMSLYGGSRSRPRMRIYDGVEEIKRAMTEALDCHSGLLLGFLAMKSLMEIPGEDWMRSFIDTRVARGITLRVIRARSSETDMVWPDSDDELRRLRYAPAHMDLRTTMFISDDKLVYVSSQAEHYAMVVTSQELASFHRSMFDFLWPHCETA